MRNLMQKHEMTEEDIKRIYITPNITSKWDVRNQVKMEQVFTD